MDSNILRGIHLVDNIHLGLEFRYFNHDLLGLALNKTKFDGEHIKFIFKAVVEQLQSLHAAGVVHRDIKTSNILVGNNGEVVLTDFGHSVSLKKAINSFNCGTLNYSSPEMVKGFLLKNKNVETNDIDPIAADIWSLGCVLAELIIGFPLFYGARTNSQMILKFFQFFGKLQIFDDLTPFLSETEKNFIQVREFKEHPLKTNFYSKYSLTNKDLLDLLFDILNPEPKLRPSIADILNHSSLENFDESNAKISLVSKLVSVDKDCHELKIKNQLVNNNNAAKKKSEFPSHLIRNGYSTERVNSNLLNKRNHEVSRAASYPMSSTQKERYKFI